MRNRWFALGLAVALPFALLGACNSDTETVQTTTAAGGMGGSGGGSSSASSSSSSSSASSSSGIPGCSDRTFDNVCEEACCYVEVTCMKPGICGILPMFQCGEPSSECPAACALAAECDDIGIGFGRLAR